MTQPIAIDFKETELDALAGLAGKLAVLATPDGKLDPAGRRLNRLTKGAVARVLENDAWEKLSEGEGMTLNFAAGLEATALQVVKLARRPAPEAARKAGATLAKYKGKHHLTLCAGATQRVAEISLGLAPVVIRDIYKAVPKIKDAGASLIVVEQDIGQALKVADRVYCMMEGRITLEGAPANVSRDAIHNAYFGAAA